MRSGSPPGWPNTPPIVSPATGSDWTGSAGRSNPETATRARSRFGSNATTVPPKRLPSSRITVVSSSPATTWALVTTRSSATTNPVPSCTRLHAAPSILVTDRATARRGGDAEAALHRGRAELGSGPQRVEDVGEVVGADQRLERLHGVGRRGQGGVDLLRDPGGRRLSGHPAGAGHQDGQHQPDHHDETGQARARHRPGGRWCPGRRCRARGRMRPPITKPRACPREAPTSRSPIVSTSTRPWLVVSRRSRNGGSSRTATTRPSPRPIQETTRATKPSR